MSSDQRQLPKSLEETKGSKYRDNTICDICHDPLTAEDKSLTHISHLAGFESEYAPCHTSFHRGCLIEWLDAAPLTNRTCPTCRATIEPPRSRAQRYPEAPLLEAALLFEPLPAFQMPPVANVLATGAHNSVDPRLRGWAAGRSRISEDEQVRIRVAAIYLAGLERETRRHIRGADR